MYNLRNKERVGRNYNLYIINYEKLKRSGYKGNLVN